MGQLKHYTIIGMLFVLVTGILAHFLYEWTGNSFIVGLFAPINESVREHMKLIFFPMLLYSFVMIFKLKGHYPGITSAACFGILLGTALIPIFFYSYTWLIGHNLFILDITIFTLGIIIGFFAIYKFTLSCKLKNYKILLCLLVCISIICFMLSTYSALTPST